ncbi:MAG: TonB-dependent receptor [Sphingomonadales bacterium]|nr:TonB-dependent receptor [Sphingomonadales bacterium]
MPKNQVILGRFGPMLIALLLHLSTTITALSQDPSPITRHKLSGTVTEEAGKKSPLPGVTVWVQAVITQQSQGTTTDAQGRYELMLPKGRYVIRFSYVGFESQSLQGEISRNTTIDVALRTSTDELTAVVVTAGRFEQRTEEVTVSMEVVRPSALHRNAITRFDDALDRVPGVQIVNGQLNIRGTSGFSYGIGSRVQVMVDDMPLLAGDAGDVKWNFIPIENISQIEVVKGAASALYGSAALGGIVNLRTAYPTETPRTEAQLFSYLHDAPRDFFKTPYRISDGRNQSGFGLLHSRQIGRNDITIGLFVVEDRGYRIGEFSQRLRGNLNWRLRLSDRISLSMSTNAMTDTFGNFFFWENDTLAFFPSPGTNDTQRSLRWTLDPCIYFYGLNGQKTTLRNRFYLTENRGDSSRNTRGEVYLSELQHQRTILPGLVATAGLFHQYNYVNSGILFGLRSSRNLAVYMQADHKIGRFNYSIGVRLEQFVIDSGPPLRYPVVRLGLNYHVAPYTWIRSSFGQGFRTPSIAERYVSGAAGPVQVFPNPSLSTERGWSAETGIRQIWKWGSFTGLTDLALFWTQYENMIEFRFGFFPGGAGFQARNLENRSSMIRGIEFTTGATGSWRRFKFNGQLGYTYIQPIEWYQPVPDRPDILLKENLKYRTPHIFRSDLELRNGRFTTGSNLRFNSFMTAIDSEFETLIPGVAPFRSRRASGDLIIDLRMSYDLRSDLSISFLIRNAGNRDYMIVPGNIGPPRTWGIQLRYNG